MYKYFFSLLLASFSMSTLASGALRFATNATNPPFEFLNKDNQLVGFDIDLAKALCQRMQSECVFINNDFTQLLPSLRFARYDAVISGVDITDERLKQVDFTQPYLVNSGSIVAMKNRYNSITQLKGKRVGVGGETTQQAYLQSKWPDIIPVVYDNYDNALLDMHNGRLDGIFGDTPAVKQLLKINPQLAMVGDPIIDSNYFGQGLGIAVRKGNDQLLKQLNDALQPLKEDGTLQRLTMRWLSAGS
ncbi:transporter substrate-binding domain-containing protein [Erwinia psidii]|uniref:Arginine ABC transporter substrate-binding protein n=1 Tax=Erwinia psidii TaxID=69224 RepID=A0A3N6UQH9_9GAMM|nr:transporter substrate-binding domain-containing protein [Erwinia psidii]MCX8957353.1 arginine ABC transporter substrate-binding protein [Erwinia psidii]MCX8959723.1 arginine ABC transporter substrate-binding protein [Erwinia psidii]MCX8964666.1 arginine ABC transporter substrate-binding protein [Erwinia psidii]RQM38219.1 arginine ABC transporter substrate-binding protein [Erwinia psidii]